MALDRFEGDATPGADSWSVGCILYRLFTGKFYHSRHAKPSPRQGLTEKGLSEAGICFIEQCCKEKPEERLTATAALQHPWLTVEAGSVEVVHGISQQLREKLYTRSVATTATGSSYVYSFA